MDISFVIPCYCSEKNIDIVIGKIYQAMNIKEDTSFEIILVNDHSSDNTWRKILELSENHKEIVGLNFSKNFGQHNALMAGFRVAKGELIMTSDDDGQTPVERVWDFKDKIDEGYDVVCAKYTKRLRKEFSRWLGTFLNEYMLKGLLDKPDDVELASFFMARRFVIDEICRYEQAFPYMAGLLLRTTRNIGNIELVQDTRASGASGYNLRKLLELWVNGFTSFSVEPLRLFTKLGFLMTVLGGILVIVAVVQKLIYRINVLPGYTSIISLMCIIGGVNLSVVGMVGEYIGRMFMCLNHQPQYVVKNYAHRGSESSELPQEENRL